MRTKKRTKKRPTYKLKGGTTKWMTLTERDRQSICKKKPPKSLENLGECYKYNDNKDTRPFDKYLWIRTKYNMADVSQAEDIIGKVQIVTEDQPGNIADIAEGIHNFVLFWDDATNTYSLALAYFNAIEFGTKHNIINLRTAGQTPDTFIISGEINKIGTDILFHDTSSQFFDNEVCGKKSNIKWQSPLIYLYSLLDSKKSPDAQLDHLKREILAGNNEFKGTEGLDNKIKKAATFAELEAILKDKLPVKGAIFSYYITLITDILSEAFVKLFRTKKASSAKATVKPTVTVKFVGNFKDAEYGEQKNVKMMIDDLCSETIPSTPFAVYETEDSCKAEDSSRKINDLNGIADFNACKIPSDYISKSKDAKERKTSTKKK